MRAQSTSFRLIILLTFLSGILLQTQAQQGRVGTFSVRGKVLDAEASAPLAYATVVLLSPGDSSIVTGTVTGENGGFNLEAKAGSYLLKVNFLGYETRFIEDLTLGSQQVVNVGDLALATANTTLDEVEITSRKSRMEFSMDKKIFNVGQDLANIGGSVTDLLDNIPSISSDIDGNISLRGSQSVRILINGRPSNMAAAEALQQLPANMVERVEIVTNPSARYEAQGTAGVLNIVLKKNRKEGWNGSINAGGGIPTNANATVNLNFRRDRLNWFGSLGGRYSDRPRVSTEHRERFSDGVLSSIIDQDETSTRGGWSGNTRFGLDYMFDENTILTGSVFYRIDDGNNSSDIDYFFYNQNRELTGRNERATHEEEDEKGIDLVLNFEKKFKGNDNHKLTANLSHESGNEIEASSALEKFFSPDGQLNDVDLNQRIYNEENEEEWILQVDYIQPIGEEGKFEAGYRGGIRRIDTRFSVEAFDEELQNWEIYPELTNNFDYDEDIHALYATYGNKVNKFSYMMGLRMEYTDINTILRNTNEENPRDYLNLFPSVYLNYDINEGNAVQLNYSRRLDRPRFWDLNPFFNFDNPLYIRSGNPNLNPEFTHSFETSYIKTWGKASLSSSIYYRYTQDVITRVIRVDEDGVSRSMPENLTTRNDIGAEFSLNLNPVKGLDMTWSGNFFRGEIDGANVGFASQTVFTAFTSRFNTRVEFLDKYQGQLMINYRGPEKNPQGMRKAFLFADLGISRDFLKDKATLTFKVSNLFNSFFKYEATGQDFYIYREGQWRTQRQFLLDFTYRINQPKRRDRGDRGGRGGDDFGGEE